MEVVVILLYVAASIVLFSYSCAQLSLLWNYWYPPKPLPAPTGSLSALPLVTIQLPIYNERYVVERLLKALIALHYPKNCLEIQVLDDSTDETRPLLEKLVAQYQSEGFDIKYIRRSQRTGFKAGALAYGLQEAKGDLIAIFDADFIPKADFLEQTLLYFQTPKVGVVQTRWGHLNQSYSLLTTLQAFGLDGHFTVEQGGRNAGGHFINFNGTAGIWRKACIIDAGGWSADTLTEDLDLSYRAQLRGWEFVYLEGIVTPAELPATMPALKSQQYRWMKGAAECARKNLSAVWQNKAISVYTKIFATFHLLNSGVFVAVLLMSLLSLPLLFITTHSTQYHTLLGILRLFQLSIIVLVGFYATAHYSQKTFWQLAWQLPLFLTVIMGLSLHNAIAVVEGYLGKKTPFIRTPKWGIVEKQDSWTQKKYLLKSFNLLTMLELLLCLYFISGIVLGVYWAAPQLIVMHAMLAIGFGFVSFYSIKHSLV